MWGFFQYCGLQLLYSITTSLSLHGTPAACKVRNNHEPAASERFHQSAGPLTHSHFDLIRSAKNRSCCYSLNSTHIWCSVITSYSGFMKESSGQLGAYSFYGSVFIDNSGLEHVQNAVCVQPLMWRTANIIPQETNGISPRCALAVLPPGTQEP